jgi:glutathionyl-hydroquinone reductase
MALDTAGGYASPVDASLHGAYPSPNLAPLSAGFMGRITANGSSGYPAEAGRYHVYAGRFCPSSQRVLLTIALNRLEDTISIGYVDNIRDGRGWAFRERTGADTVNGFTLLREAYAVTEPDYDGPVRLPVLWDRRTGRIVSDDSTMIGIDIATQFDRWATPRLSTYSPADRERIEELDRWLRPAVTLGVPRAAVGGRARDELVEAFRALDCRLAASRYLLGDHLTDADVRLWVTLVRYDVGPNAHGNVGPRLDRYPHLWAYARDLYRLPAFRRTTDFASFAAPFAAIPDWDAPAGRGFDEPLWSPGDTIEGLGGWSVTPVRVSVPTGSSAA